MKDCDLPATLKKLAEHGAGNIVIVPGGGIFADQVRYLQKELRIDEETAHRMALRAMEQFGTLILSFDPRFHAATSIDAINEWINKKEIPVWFPFNMVADNPLIRSSWDITSDSLSLWLAQVLDCQNLVLLKSTEPKNENYSASYLSQSGYLDNAFAEMIEDTFVKPWWLFYEQMQGFINLLDNDVDSSISMKEITRQ